MRGMDGGWMDEDEDECGEAEEYVTTPNQSFVPIGSVREMIDCEVSEKLRKLQNKEITSTNPNANPEVNLISVKSEINTDSKLDISELRKSVKSFKLMEY